MDTYLNKLLPAGDGDPSRGRDPSLGRRIGAALLPLCFLVPPLSACTDAGAAAEDRGVAPQSLQHEYVTPDGETVTCGYLGSQSHTVESGETVATIIEDRLPNIASTLVTECGMHEAPEGEDIIAAVADKHGLSSDKINDPLPIEKLEIPVICYSGKKVE